MAVGVLLFLMQLHGYQHTRFPEDFPLNKDEVLFHGDSLMVDERSDAGVQCLWVPAMSSWTW